MPRRPIKHPDKKPETDRTAAISEVERFKRRAAFDAMYKYTFGIVSDDDDGFEGRGMGSGVGVVWKDSHLILTAAHVLKRTPLDRLYFMVPLEPLVFADSVEKADRNKLQMQQRGQFEKQQGVISKDYDLADVIVPSQEEETTRGHFYQLDGGRTTVRTGNVVGFSGYPSCKAQPFGANFAAFPFCDIGKVCSEPIQHDRKAQMLVRYYCAAEVDPHGLSGGGVWAFQRSGSIWSPRIALAGLLTHYQKKRGVLTGYRAATILRFLRDIQPWIDDRSTQVNKSS